MVFTLSYKTPVPKSGCMLKYLMCLIAYSRVLSEAGCLLLFLTLTLNLNPKFLKFLNIKVVRYWIVADVSLCLKP